MPKSLQDAIRWHRKGRLDKAERIYRALLRADPGQVDALNFLGVLYHQKGAVEPALRLLRRATTRDPAYLDAQVNLARVLLSAGEAQAARATYEQVLRIDAGNALACAGLCALLRAQGEIAAALEMGRRAVASEPAMAGAWVNYANALNADGQYREAAEAYRRGRDLDPTLSAAHRGLSEALYRLEHLPQAPQNIRAERAAAYRAWCEAEGEHPVAGFMLQAVEGGTAPARAPDGFVSALFDDFAERFDEVLGQLEYRVPDLVAERLQALAGVLPPAPLRVLDAGCGTGLCAATLRPLAARLVGVDLSRGMLERAGALSLYDALEHAELVAWLGGTDERFDLVVCADTLCYFGDLDQVLGALARTLAPGGLVLFTVERLDGQGSPDHRLEASGRYRHRRDYLEGALRAGPWEAPWVEAVTLRQEGAETVAGLLVSARRGA